LGRGVPDKAITSIAHKDWSRDVRVEVQQIDRLPVFVDHVISLCPDPVDLLVRKCTERILRGKLITRTVTPRVVSRIFGFCRRVFVREQGFGSVCLDPEEGETGVVAIAAAEGLHHCVSISNSSELAAIDGAVVGHAMGLAAFVAFEGGIVQEADLVAVWRSESPCSDAETIVSVWLDKNTLEAMAHEEASRIWGLIAIDETLGIDSIEN